MQGTNLLKRRGLEEGAEPHCCRPKRACLEAELQVPDYSMETSEFVPLTNQQQEQQVGVVRQRHPQLCCARCLGGEPGHISHIMGL